MDDTSEETSSSHETQVGVEEEEGSDERERRQVQHYSHGTPTVQIGQPAFPIGRSSSTERPYSVRPPYTPTGHLTHHSGYSQPSTTTRANTYHLTKGLPVSKSHSTSVYKSSSGKRPNKPTLTKAPLTYKSHSQPHHRRPPPPRSHSITSFKGIVIPSEVTPVSYGIGVGGGGHGGYVSSEEDYHGGISGYTPPRPNYGYGGGGSCDGGEVCVPLVWCAPCYNEIKEQRNLACSLQRGSKGICCPNLFNARSRRSLFVEPKLDVREMSFTDDVVDEAARAALWQIVERDLLESALQERNIEVNNPQRPEFGHLQFFKTTPRATKISRDGLTGAGASDYLLTRFRLNALEAAYGLQQVSISNSIISDTCPRTPRCEEKDRFYRTIDGSCNNLDNPGWGQARSPFQRILPPQYSDGLLRPRESRVGGPLPSARVVSLSVVNDVDNPNPDITLSVMQWGQFIDHDLTHTPIFRFNNRSGIECCEDEGRRLIDPSFLHPSCFPIEIPENDPFYSRLGRRCMNFVRSMIAPRSGCTLGYAEQLNQITHHLDGSNIYGSSREEEELLREGRGGRLKVQRRSLLPPDFEAEECESIRDGLPCFRAGDNRVNEQVELTVIHTVWVRFHNIIASILAAQNPEWSDETLYQEARRIVVAIYQHIIYNEWLPLVIGKDYMARSGLLPLREGFSNDYDPSVNPTVTNEFATSAFRFGHTLVQGMIDLVGKKGQGTDRLQLRTQFNNPRLIYTPGRLDQFLRGLATQPAQQVDNFVTSELTNRLFETPEMPFGMDLVALNIQRGRDHAIAPYNDLRSACGLPKAEDFDDLLDVVPTSVVSAFRRVYRTVEDIDPFVAGISERHASGAILGPTFRCIVADQFARLKQGDRFFYELGDQPTSFTDEQLFEIRQMSWARILCLTGDNLMYVQPLAFLQPRGLNERTTCDDPAIPQINLTPWQSRRSN
ncbi:hypothetical protein Pmani_004472 [Petrolisthes manimaculis]|uniref:Chorion peroxidase n=1 Tax=Petrolisthes manimaculis TaxID=1843537 RepID=A0AAE1QEK7_9EUCA|nr:hypothetical protein Pmani_004472 [Petrolisthes manimaculis]KAK4324938.1 hypothetical protein Pmani_004472 [Petrolisthes manimaculis]